MQNFNFSLIDGLLILLWANKKGTKTTRQEQALEDIELARDTIELAGEAIGEITEKLWFS